MTLKEINPTEFSSKSFDLFSNQWALVTVGTKEKFNMMTIGWGTLGTLWGSPYAIVFVRPSRYTYEFMEKHDTFSITTFTSKYKNILNLCGSKSGRDIDKMEIDGLTPVEKEGTVYFEESEVTLICKKQYFNDLIPERIPTKVEHQYYKGKDYHRVYYGEILRCYIKS